MTGDPMMKLRRWLAQARRAAAPLPEAMALATADARGRPAVRYVLLKQVDARGVVFFTNTGSRKGRELRANPRASAAFYWDRIGKQVRIDGRIEAVAVADADEYWVTRPRPSQLAAVASNQSAGLASRRVLIARWRAMRRAFAGRSIPRPAGWTGYRIVPDAIEFWTRHEPRLHDRQLYLRTARGWKRQLLQP